MKTLDYSPRLPTPDSLGALSVGELNSPRVAPLPTPDSQLPTPDSRFPVPSVRFP
ncbi:MAG: hypothetical protein F6J90_40175 [Moorea sp. SIOASIH]|uniref:hypothetical protein n=1 Tax=Moorena sp. SIOASIH TaxID=2607817 RepID=UPI0013B9341B|nr:hypothetical protein [Moorena sp. SIOASIH]NEO42208.1 hypothetical protein [Moorena sp. SIOASIH]